MLAFRTILAIALTVCGAIVVVRIAGFGLRAEILPGLVLGVAMIALGVHRLTLIARVWRGDMR